MVTSTDLCNRALQMAAARDTITSLADASNEANQCALLYSAVLDWCLGIANWNFARKIAILTLNKTRTNPPASWSTADPAPPWVYEYAYPSDCVRMRYVMNQTVRNLAWVGEPAKFAVGTSMTTPGNVVINTNEAVALGVYTYRDVTIDNWPQLFTQALITTLASYLAIPISGDKELANKLLTLSQQHLDLAVMANLREGLWQDDTTVEWLQARGIPYPEHRAPLSAAPKVVPQNG